MTAGGMADGRENNGPTAAGWEKTTPGGDPQGRLGNEQGGGWETQNGTRSNVNKQQGRN